MNAILANPVAVTVLPALVIGLLLGLLAWITAGNRLVMALGWGIGVLAVYWLLEGVPPFPPAAAKQKLDYVLVLGALAGVAVALLPVWRWLMGAKSAGLAVLAVLWLGWSKLGDTDSGGVLALAAACAAILVAGLIAVSKPTGFDADGSEQPFVLPAAMLTTAIAGAVVAASGLFLGMGQMLGAFAAMLGGALLVSYLALLVRGSGLALLGHGAAIAVGNAILAAIVLTALLAPSPSPAGLVILSATPLWAATLDRFGLFAALPSPRQLRPILTGAIIAVPAIAAILIAVLTGTSPFA